MPGIGAQGGSIDVVKSVMDNSGNGVLVPISQGITKPESVDISLTEYATLLETNTKFFVNKLRTIFLH